MNKIKPIRVWGIIRKNKLRSVYWERKFLAVEALKDYPDGEVVCVEIKVIKKVRRG